MSENIRTVAIIGGGFSGICAAIQLREKLGIIGDIFETNKKLEGVWFANTYPGCACDTPSHNYCLSFELNPLWSRNFSGQPEIYEYIQGVAKKYDLYSQTKLETEVICTTWLEEIHKWRVEWCSVNDRTKVNTGLYDYVFSCVGALNMPYTPKELHGFQGTVIHTAKWDSSVDLTNKRIAVVGSGSSAAQVIPEISKQAAHLYSYQRSAAWVLPSSQYNFYDFFKKMFVYLPFTLHLFHLFHAFTDDIFYVCYSQYNNSFGKFIRYLLTMSITRTLRRAGRPDLAALLIPNYTPGCKRVIRSTNYLHSMARDNVTLIPNAVKKVYGHTIVDTSDQETEVDILVLATGFNVRNFIGNINVIGKNNISLNDIWTKGFPKTHKTVNVKNFPNLFVLAGPTTLTGHNSIVSIVECQVNLNIRNIKHMIENNFTYIEPLEEAQEEFSKDVAHRLKNTVWNTGCGSWYKSESGELSALWPGSVTNFWWEMRKTKYSEYMFSQLSNKAEI